MTKELCNEMAILNGGKILTQGTPKRLQMRWKPSTQSYRTGGIGRNEKS
jgi:ABC-type multidrug transport system ATPase subunit